MNEPTSTNPSDDRNKRPLNSSGGSGHAEIESPSFQDAFALEGLLRKIGQDCRKEPLQYLERTQAWQEGE